MAQSADDIKKKITAAMSEITKKRTPQELTGAFCCLLYLSEGHPPEVVKPLASLQLALTHLFENLGKNDLRFGKITGGRHAKEFYKVSI